MYWSTAHHLDQMMTVVTHLEDLAGDFHTDFIDDPQDITLSYRGIRSHHEIGSAQRVEVRGVVGGVEDAVEHLAQLLGRRWGIDVE